MQNRMQKVALPYKTTQMHTGKYKYAQQNLIFLDFYIRD